MGTLKIVVADDHSLWRSGLRTELSAHHDVVAEAANAADAITAIRAAEPDVVLCDLHMPGGGLAVVEACSAETAIIILTMSERETDLLAAVAAGALGYLLKTVDPAELRAAIDKAASGEPVFTPGLAQLVLGEFRRIARHHEPVDTLTRREREVLQHVARGNTYRAVGEALFISERTVETHVRNILGKLQLQRREELARYAADHDIL